MAIHNKTDYFWTDYEQAVERLQGCLVLYDGVMVYIDQIEPHDDGVPRARLSYLDGSAKKERKMLNSPKFKNFREMPKLGWFNHSSPDVGALYVSRITTRHRSHGLNDTNVSIRRFAGKEHELQPGPYHLRNIMADGGFNESHENIFPSVKNILKNIGECQSIAYSRDYCISRDALGIRWLYRKTDKVGLFTGNDTLNLAEKFSFLREEVQEDPLFTLNNIKEF